MKLNSLNYKVTAGVLFVGLLGVSIIISSVQGQKAAAPELAQYFVVFLVKGPRWTAEETPETNRLQAEHLAHIGQLHDSGKLLLAGPFPDDGNLRGMGIFKTSAIEEAKQLAEDDESVRTGINRGNCRHQMISNRRLGLGRRIHRVGGSYHTSTS